MDLALIDLMKHAAVAYCTGHTGLTKTELDDYEDITVAVLALISDMWDKRAATVSSTSSAFNRVIENILAMHSVNLLPDADESETVSTTAIVGSGIVGTATVG